MGSAHGQNVEFRQSSSPAGVVNQVTFPVQGSQTSTVTAPLNPTGYQFTHWTLNGTRMNFGTGRAQNPVIFTIQDPVEAVAYYLPETQDSDADGILDWREIHHLGTLATGPLGDPETDGFPTGVEIFRGYDPAAKDSILAGGVGRRRSGMITLTIPDPGLLDTDRDGMIRRVEDFRGYRDDVADSLQAGGSSRRRSVSTLIVLDNNRARLREISSPAGVFVSERAVLKGTSVALLTAPLESSGYRYTGWFVNGTRVDSPPLHQPVSIVINDDSVAVARYIHENADTDGDGIADWLEMYFHETLNNNLDSDPDDDTIAWKQEAFRGYSTLAKDRLDAGGVSRRRSGLLYVDTTGGRQPWRMSSLPGGMVNQDGLAVPSSWITTPDLASSSAGDQKFAYWEVNGVRQADPGGYSRTQVTFQVNGPVNAVAFYFNTTLDDDFDGIQDWYERAHFGNLNRSVFDDGDDDGFSIGGEIFRGQSPLVRNRLVAGGISRRRSGVVAVNSVQVTVPPYVTINGVTDITPTSARLNALVNPAGLSATAYFEHGGTSSFGTSTAPVALSGSTSSSLMSAPLTGLQPATIYYFRAVAQNSRGTTSSETLTFSTLWDALAGEGFEDAGVAGRWQTTAGAWQFSPQAAFTGASGAGTTAAGATYAPASDSRLVSPIFEVPTPAGAFPRLKFNHRWDFGTGDHGAVEIREGTTGPWQTAATFVGQSGGWVEKQLDLSGYVGRRIQVAFRLRANADASTGAGWAVDNVSVITGTPTGWAANTPDTFEPVRFWREWTAVGQTWAVGTPTTGPAAAFDGTTSAGTSLSGGTYPANFDGRLISPFFQVPPAGDNPRFRFWHWYHLGYGDRGVVEIRRPGGEWQALDTYTGGAANSAWTKPTVNLSSAAGEWVQLAFRLVSDAFDNRAGWYVDLAELATGPEVLNNPETFDGDIGDWYTDANGIWQIGRPTSGPGAPKSGNNVAATNLSGNYPPASIARLESPSFPVGDPGSNRLVTLRFWQWYQYGAGDQGRVEISQKNGEVWSDWVTLNTVTGNSGGWQRQVVDLSAYKGQTVRLSFFHAADADGSTGPGWYIDDLEITSMVRAELVAGTPLNTDLVAGGEYHYYVLNFDEAGPLNLSVFNNGSGNRVEVYASRGHLPSRSNHEHGNANGPGASRDLLIPWASAGTWYILVYADTVATPGTLTINAESQRVALTGASPSSNATNQPLSMTISGAGFGAGTIVELVSGTSVIAASSVSLDSFTQLTASFAANAVPPGAYHVRVRRPGAGLATLTSSFYSLEAGIPRLETKLIMPSGVGPNTPATLYIEYANTGNAAMPAPLLILRAPDGGNRPILTLDQALSVQNFWAGTSSLPPGAATEIAILASGDQPGVLHPGEKHQAPVYYSGLLQPFTATTLSLEVVALMADDPNPIDWAPLKNNMRPQTISSEVWDIVFANLTNGLTTNAAYMGMLNENAAYLGRLGQRVINVNDLWQFEMQQAFGYSPLATVDEVTDAVVVQPGPALSVDRSFSSSLRSRWEVGPFGRGWFTSWQTHLVSESGGAVVRIVGAGGSGRVYVRDTRNGSYFSNAGDTAKLLVVGGAFEIHEPSGDITRFNSLGRVAVMDDVHGNRVSASYTSGRLTALTHSSGGSITFTYDGQGKVSQVTESTGRTANYTYQGDYLTTVTTGDGKVTSYTYLTSGDAARRHALTSVARGGATRNFSWDEHGRLATSTVAGGTQVMTWTYGTAGSVTVANLSGGSTYFFDHRGLPVKTVDPLGHITTAEFDGNFRPRRQIFPTGDSRIYSWTASGSLASLTDELGNTSRFRYEGPLGKMSHLIDAKGNMTRFGYNVKGSLLDTTYPDNSVETLGQYTAQGLPQSYVNRRSQVIQSTYTPSGLVDRRTLPDGSYVDYDYDARGNLVQTTDHPVSGPDKITQFSFDHATDGDRLKKVTYPNGSWVEYNYDAHGRRNRMTDSAGGDSRYEYDGLARLTGIRNSANALMLEYLYDNVGRLGRCNKANGTYTTYEYNAAGQFLRLTNHAPNGSANSDFIYAYDARGRRSSMDTLDGRWEYSYDATGQLVRAVFDSTNAEMADQDLRYQYDAVGNRTATIINGATTEYASNGLNQYTKVGGVNHTYDLDGNLVNDGTNTYTFDVVGRLTSVTSPDGTSAFTYDAFDQRATSTMPGQTTQFLYDVTGKPSCLAELDGSGNTLSRTLYGMDVAARITGAGASAVISFMDFDSLGNAVGVTNALGVQVEKQFYLPFGQVAAPASSVKPFQFSGQFGSQQTTAGLTHMGARHYSSAMGRFISADPIGFAGGGANIYSYALNDPINAIDPQGTTPLILVGAVVGGGTNALFYMAANPKSWTWAGVGGNALSGAIQGGLVYSGVGPLAGAAAGALGNGIGYFIENGANWNPLDLAVEIGIGSIPWTWGLAKAGRHPKYLLSAITGKKGIGLMINQTSLNFGSAALKELYKWLKGLISNTFANIPIIVSRDPNEKLGPVGVGVPNWITGKDAFPYRINFENLGPGSKDANGDPYPTFATAPAQRVTVTDQLPAQLDWSSFKLTEMGFGDEVISVPENRSHYATTTTMTYNGKFFEVEIEAGIDFNTGLVSVSFQSMDPESGLPPAVDVGFLPPEDGTGRGMGHVSFLINAKAEIVAGTQVRNVAVIRFDGNETIATNQIDPQDASKGTDPAKEALVTLDGTAPVCTISALPAVSEGGVIPVVWTGDDQSGSGIVSYDVYVSKGGGAFELWLEGTTSTSAAFETDFVGVHAFYARARDLLGQTDTSVPQAQASTRMIPGLNLAGIANNGSVVGRLGVELKLDAIPEGTQVTRVEYYANGMLLGEGVGALFNLRWSPTLSGMHLVRVVGYNAQGEKTASGDIHVNVTHIGTYAGGIKGVYNGLVRDPQQSWAYSGYVSMTSTTTGAFTLKLIMGGKTYSIKGTFNPQGTAEVSLARKGLNALRFQLIHSSTPNVDQIVGQVSDGVFNGPVASGHTFVSALRADRLVWETKLKPATALTGSYTLLMPAHDEAAAQKAPLGTGYGTATIGKDGSAKLASVLADGTAATASSYLSKDGLWPLYVALYSNTGMIIGDMSFTEQAAVSDFNGPLTWYKPATAKAAIFKDSFTTEVEALGSHFAKPAANVRMLPLVNVGGNSRLYLTDGGLTPAITRLVTLSAANKAVIPLQGADAATLTLTPASGLVAGSFLHPQIQKAVKFNGALLQKQNIVGGFFLNGPQGGNVRYAASPDYLPSAGDAGPIGISPLPTVTVAAPAANAVLTKFTGNAVVVTGKAVDKQGIAHVQVQVLHDDVLSPPAMATVVSTVASSGTMNWTYSIPIATGEGGIYQIMVKSVDTLGQQSEVLTVPFILPLKSALVVAVNDASKGSVSSGFLGSTQRDVGKLVTITATPKSKKKFTGWSGSIVSSSPKITILMKAGMSLQANFSD